MDGVQIASMTSSWMRYENRNSRRSYNTRCFRKAPVFFCFFFSEWDVLVSHRKIAAWIKLIWKLNRYNSFELNCLTIFNGTSRRCTANDKVFFSHLTCCTKNSNVFVRMHCSMSKKVWRRRVVGKDEQTIQLNCL